MINYKENGDFLPTDTLNVSDWVSESFSRFSLTEQEQLLKAAQMIQQSGQIVVTELGDQLFFRGLRIAELVNELGLDYTCILASLIYPVFEYYSAQSSPEALNIALQCTRVSASCTALLFALQKVSVWEAGLSEQGYATGIKQLRKLLLAIIQDVSVVLLLVAEQVYKMRLAIHASAAVQHLLGRITWDLYIPLSNRLGLGNFKWELEDLAFRFQSPEAYRELAKLLDDKRVNREAYIKKVTEQIKAAMAEKNITAIVNGRAKHLYSIWKKMQRKGVSYDEIYDIRAFRVIVETIPDCYRALGVIHERWQSISKEFDDYIAHPKANGYQSLHTAVIGEMGETLEIQIRTQAMHAQAELGVAAHWLYKSEQLEDWLNSPEQVAFLESIRNLLADSERFF